MKRLVNYLTALCLCAALLVPVHGAEPLTRGELAELLHARAGSPAPADPAAWAMEEGVLTGYPDGSFRPEGAVTRQQLAAVLWRQAGKPAASGSGAFSDGADVANYARTAVDWASSVGIIKGFGDGTFRPAQTATRAQAETVLARYDVMTGRTLSEVSAMDVMCAPSGIAAMSDGSILVTDTYHKRLWRVRQGVSQVYAGTDTAAGLYGEPVGGYNDAKLLASSFKRPWAVAEFLDGWAVSDMDNNAVRIVRSANVQTLNGKTEEKLTVSSVGVVFARPTGLAADGEGNLYVADTGNGAVRVVTPKGDVTTAASGLNEPMGLCWKDGALYIAETGANRIRKLENGKLTILAGSGTDGLADGPAMEAMFAGPRGVTVGDDGSVYVADTLNSAVRRIRDGRVETVTVRDAAAESGLISPSGLLIQGNRLYICDGFARKLFVLELG